MDLILLGLAEPAAAHFTEAARVLRASAVVAREEADAALRCEESSNAILVVACDGDDDLARIARLRAAAPSSDLLALARVELVRSALARGARDVCVKSAGPDEIVARLQVLAARSDLRATSASATSATGGSLGDRSEGGGHALRESEGKFRALSEATHEAIVLHRDGIILHANDAAERLYRADGGLVGKPLMDYVAEESRELVLQRVRDLCSEPYEAYGRRGDGTIFPAEAQARTATLLDEVVRVVAIQDITARKTMEARLALADRMASMGTLAAGVAHEINNPLTFITANLELALRALAADAPIDRVKLASELGDAQQGAERVHRIVRDLGRFARRTDEVMERVDLRRVIEYASTIAHYEVKHRAVLDVQLGDIPPVVGSEARLGQVVLNLLVNAAQAIPAGHVDRNRIAVTAFAEAPSERGEPGMVVLEVTDTGAGIPKELRARIFDPFVTTKALGVGSGLGLSICHSIVTSMGGTIEAHSESERGTKMRVRLRAAERDAAQAAPGPSSSTHAPTPMRRGRILVIDDEPLLRQVLVGILNLHEVDAVPSGAAAITRLADGARFDVVLCDMMMPEMTGIDVHAEVSRRWPELERRMIFLTGGTYTARARAFLDEGAHRVLEKPFGAADLEAAVQRVLGAGPVSA